MMRRLLLFFLMLGGSAAFAEPYLAVRTGHTCGTCHVNPTGGGLRTEFGNVYAQTELAVTQFEGATPWTGQVLDRFSVGTDMRASASRFEFDDRDDNLNFAVDRVTLYLAARLNEHVSLYVDEQVAPGGSINREAWAKFAFDNWYIKAGKMRLPFGWALEDDSAFIRERTGINFSSGDNGIELGWVKTDWEVQVAVTNGRAGAVEVDDGKQVTARIAHVQPRWRIGVSGSHNSADTVDRTMAGVFAGVRTGRVAWLAEYDRIEDEDSVSSDFEHEVAFLEANIQVAKGHNLKLTAEAHLFDESGIEDQRRYSAVYEFFPWVFTQLRVGLRFRDSDGDTAALNSELVFVQAHLFL